MLMPVLYTPAPQFVLVEPGVGMWIYAFGAANPFSSLVSPNLGWPQFAADFDGDGHMEMVYEFGTDGYGSMGIFDVVTQQVEWTWVGDIDTAYTLDYWEPVDYTGEGRSELVLHYYHDNGSSQVSQTRVYTFSSGGTALVGDVPAEPQMIMAYPNPTDGPIQFSGLGKEGGTYSVFDPSGRQIRSPQTITETMNIGALPAGTYFLRVAMPGGKRATRRIVLR
jgi:hypothetical protein